MNITEWKWKSRDQLEMYAVSWSRDLLIKGVVCLVHGYAEHIHRYDHVAAMLVDAGYAVVGFDLRGHGRSGGSHGFTPSYQHLLNDIADMVAQAHQMYPNLPVFLYGHSMGGNQVVNYALSYPETIHGAIASSPWLGLISEMGNLRKGLIRFINQIFPAIAVPSGLSLYTISRDQAVLRAYVSDRLVHDKITPRLFLEMDARAQWALAHAADLKIPMLLMHGLADQLTSAKTSVQFAEKAGNCVTLRLWDGLYHELHNEPEKDDVFVVVQNWLLANSNSLK